MFRTPTQEDLALFVEPTIASQLPVKVGNFTLTDLRGHCEKCGVESVADEDLHGRLDSPIEGVLNTRMAFLCRSCKVLNIAVQRIRDTDGETRIEFQGEDGVWYFRGFHKPGLWNRIKDFFKRR